ncbi:TPA: hypothetical protein ACNV20_005595 [Pseudomonas putida]
MGKTLIITEKATVAVSIAQAVGGFSKVESWLESENAILAPAAGHLVEIHSEEMAKGGRDIGNLPVIPDQFDLRVIEPNGCSPHDLGTLHYCRASCHHPRACGPQWITQHGY